ncbi:MAG: hypothetical protein P8L85_09100 [Rubripirellula sp.]|nr:hypothetical protein [Rubripirellula sp.]
MRTGNPALNDNLYQSLEAMPADGFDLAAAPTDTMTLGEQRSKPEHWSRSPF